MYRRPLGGQAVTWCPEWWRHAEAIARLDALWRAWEHLRLDPATGMSVWFRDHADHHMAVLLSADGPFKGCKPDKGHAERLPAFPLTDAARRAVLERARPAGARCVRRRRGRPLRGRQPIPDPASPAQQSPVESDGRFAPVDSRSTVCNGICQVRWRGLLGDDRRSWEHLRMGPDEHAEVWMGLPIDLATGRTPLMTNPEFTQRDLEDAYASGRTDAYRELLPFHGVDRVAFPTDREQFDAAVLYEQRLLEHHRWVLSLLYDDAFTERQMQGRLRDVRREVPQRVDAAAARGSTA